MESERELRVTLTGDRSGDYVIVDEPEEGLLILAPDTSMAAIRGCHGLEAATLAEFEAERPGGASRRGGLMSVAGAAAAAGHEAPCTGDRR